MTIENTLKKLTSFEYRYLDIVCLFPNAVSN